MTTANPHAPIVHKAAGTDPNEPHVPGPVPDITKPLVHGAPVKDEAAHAKAKEAEEDELLQKVKNAAEREKAGAEKPEEDTKPAA